MTKRLHLIALLGLVLISVFLGYTGRDDSHITYFVSDAIANGHGIINYSGDSVEQSSTFLYTMVLGLFSFILGVKSASIAPILSPAILVLAAFTTASILKSYKLSKAITVVPFFAPPVIYWGLSGMENSLHLLLLILFVYFCERSINSARSSFNFGLFVVASFSSLVRPESSLVLICVAGGILLLGVSWRSVLRVTLITLSAVALAFLVKWQIGFDFFPNPVDAKQNLPVIERLKSGLFYFAKTFREIPFSSFLAFIFFVFSVFWVANIKNKSSASLFVGVGLLSVFAVASFSFFSGGDWMESGRFLTAAYFFSTLAFLSLAQPKIQKLAAIAFMIGCTLDLAKISSQPYGGIPYFTDANVMTENYTPSPFEQKNTIHARDISFVDKTIKVLRSSKEEDMTIGSIQAGMVPYYLVKNLDKKFKSGEKEIDFIDFVGLTSSEVHSCQKSWPYHPYENIDKLNSCVDAEIDYVYDLDFEGWPRLNELKQYGCQEKFKEKVVLKPWFWKSRYVRRQFLVRCDKVF